VTEFVCTPANVHDSQVLEDLLEGERKRLFLQTRRMIVERYARGVARKASFAVFWPKPIGVGLCRPARRGVLNLTWHFRRKGAF